MANPVSISNSPQQSSFNTPTNKQTIYYGVDKFSVGYINPATNEHELFPNNEGETLTASIVRIIDHLDGTQDVLIEKDADFQPDVAYGLGLPETVFIINEHAYPEWRLESWAPTYTCVDGEYMLVGDEWRNISRMPPIESLSYSFNETGECELYMKSDAERDWEDRLERNRAKELAETRFQSVKFAVVMIPSLSTSTSKSPQPESTIDAAARVELETVRVLDDSEAAVLACDPVISREETIAGRPRRIVMYYLNSLTEEITMFEASRAQPSEDKDEGGFLGLKEVTKYHFYQAVWKRMLHALAKRMFERYTAGEYHTDENSHYATGVHAERLNHPIAFSLALDRLDMFAPKWSPETRDVQERYWVSAYDYILF
ncbi:hypothetical protein BGX30_010033 [Mortierella sp. GBA39]|nr:hypothetical protein BGX30_010033 [Mortierella sp. GBA39]